MHVGSLELGSQVGLLAVLLILLMLLVQSKLNGRSCREIIYKYNHLDFET